MTDFETWWEGNDDDLYLLNLNTYDELQAFAEKAWQAAQQAEAKKSEMLVQCLLAIKGISNDHAAVSLAEHALKDWGKDALDT